MGEAADLFIGVDVQVARGCPWTVLDAGGDAVDAGWLPTERAGAVAGLRAIAARYGMDRPGRVAIGIDAPRRSLVEPRGWYWNGDTRRWRRANSGDRGWGRHCEVVVAALGLANPQWTRLAAETPGWMELGFALFAGLEDRWTVHEVFPSAAYSQLDGDPSVKIAVRLGRFARGPKDMLDACMAAATVREFVQGRGCSVGGGDGLGSIVLPRPVPQACAALLEWPAPIGAAACR